MDPEVSVLIPMYRSEKYIGAAIESVLAQSFSDFEIIAADDGSDDNSARIAASYPKVRCFSQEHTGISAARNLALSNARGRLIAFLDSDDLWTPDKLELQVAYLHDHPECGIVFCRYQNFSDIEESERNTRQQQILGEEISRYLAGACIRREMFETFGAFNEKYPFGEDTEWLARLRVALVDLDHKIDKYLYLRRIHDHNISLTHNDMSESERYAIMADAIRNKWRRKKNG